MMTIRKFNEVWDKTKDIHSTEYRDFIDLLWYPYGFSNGST